MTNDKHVSAQSDDKFSAIRDLFRIVKTWPRPEDQEASISMLRKLQKRAKVQAVEGQVGDCYMACSPGRDGLVLLTWWHLFCCWIGVISRGEKIMWTRVPIEDSIALGLVWKQKKAQSHRMCQDSLMGRGLRILRLQLYHPFQQFCALTNSPTRSPRILACPGLFELGRVLDQY